MTSAGWSLAKFRIDLAVSTGSPVMKAIAEGPANWPSKASTPASLAAMSVRVFFTTAYVACSLIERRSLVSWATVSPRYSVSTAAWDSRNFSVSSATAAALSGLAMGLLPRVKRRRLGPAHDERPGARRTGRGRARHEDGHGNISFT